MAKERGDYVVTYRVLLTSPEYERLSLEAAAVLHALRFWPDGNMAGIFPIFREELAHYSKVELDKIQPALRELEQEKWIVMEGRWIWIRNFLRFNSGFAKANPKHRAGVIAVLNGFPRMSLIRQFLDYYIGLGFITELEASECHSIPIREAIDTHPIPVAVSVTVSVTETVKTETDPPSGASHPPEIAKAVEIARRSWSSEACALWQQFLGTPPGDRIGKALKPWITKHGPETVLPLWQSALEEAVLEADPSYFTPEVFARTFVARLARAKAADLGMGQSLVRVGLRSPPKEAKRQAAMVAGVTGGLKGDGTYGGGQG